MYKCFNFSSYLLVVIIIKVTAPMASRMPVKMLLVSASPNAMVPTRMAVMGSKTPSTEALVAPIFRVEMASVAVETMVGKMASPTRYSQSLVLVMPVVMLASEAAIFEKKTTEPTERV